MKKLKRLLANNTILGLIIAFIIICAIIILIVTKGMFGNTKVEIIDFSNLTQSEIVEWFNKEFGNKENLMFSREYSETIQKDKVISQSVMAGETITSEDKVQIVLSNGADPNLEISLPDFVTEKYTKNQIEKFFDENKFNDVTYEYEISELPKDTVIKINVSEKAKRNDVIMVTLSIGEDTKNIEITVPDFSTYSVANAKAWGNANSISMKISYVFSDTHAEGKIIYQSIKANEVIKGGSSISLQVSSGKGITVEDLSGKTFEYADKWSDDNGVYIKPVYVYDDNIKEDLIIKSDPKPGTIVEKNAVITIYISKGKDPDSVLVKVDNKVGVSEKDFLAYIKELNMKTSKVGSYYSDTIASGNIYSHTSGEVKISTTIEYTLSLGKYNLDAGNFEGKSKSSADSIIATANAQKAGISLNVTEEYSDTVSRGILYNCSVSGKTLSCKLSLGALATVENYINQNKQSNFSSNNVNYVVVIDNDYTEGTSYGDVYKQSVEPGTRVKNGTTVELYVRKGQKPEEPKGFIDGNYDVYQTAPLSLSGTKTNVQNRLGMFNLEIYEEESTGLDAGVIISITVNGSSYESGEYPLSSKVVVIISKGYAE